MKGVKVTLALLHLFVAVFAFLGGWAAISDPISPFDISTAMLANSPFRSFLIPGILLFTVIGLGQLAAAVFFLFRSRYQGYVSLFFSGALIIWLFVQVLMIRTIETLHIVTFLIACIQLGLSLLLIYRERLFPTDYVMRFLRRGKHA